MRSVLNHIALLVESIESVVDENSFPSEAIGKIEDFPGEGTRKLYIGRDNQVGRLLLMQAIGDGPYKNALEKRGPGLHHIALDVEDIDSFVEQLSGSGWQLHPKSLSFYNENRQVYLCRSGIPVLMEVQERKNLADQDYFIDRVQFPFSSTKLLESLCCDRLLVGDSISALNKHGEQICQF